MIRAANTLHGERNAPELPIPNSAVRSYAQRYGFSGTFVRMVEHYDATVMEGSRRELRSKTSGSKTTPAKRP